MNYYSEKLTQLGFGLMRLPMIGEEIDLEQTKEMVDTFLAKGFTYFDTAYGYHNQKSEGIAKLALVDRYPRDSFTLATKLPAWAGPKTKEEAEQMFYTSLERCGVEYFDYYLLHNLGPSRTELFEKWEMWDFVFELKKQGKIKKVGFSIHDKADAVDAVLTKHPEVDFLQLQINYADWNDIVVQSKLCYEVAKKHGKPVVIMEPIRGGSLANPPQKVIDVLKEANSEMPLAIWALKYAASFDNVLTVLSGMSTIEQMEENTNWFKNGTVLTEKEQKAIEKAQEILASIPTIPCTSCQYCVKDCPKNINIPSILGALNKEIVYADLASAKRSYQLATVRNGKASECIGCKKCEKVCPQVIPIVEKLKIAVSNLEV